MIWAYAHSPPIVWGPHSGTWPAGEKLQQGRASYRCKIRTRDATPLCIRFNLLACKPGLHEGEPKAPRELPKGSNCRFSCFLGISQAHRLDPMSNTTPTRNSNAQVSIGHYVKSTNASAEKLAHQYAVLSMHIKVLIESYRTDLTEWSKPESGWVFPYAVNCDDPGCIECPHRVQWKSLYWNPNLGPGKFRSNFVTVDRSVIKVFGAKKARAQIDKILEYKALIDDLLAARSEIRRLLRSFDSGSKALVTRNKELVADVQKRMNKLQTWL